MRIPNLDRTIETFIQIPIDQQSHPIEIWHNYIKLLYDKVIPLIDKLREKRLIGWYSFLIHNKDNGVPTTAEDYNNYVHLRLEISPKKSEEELVSNLPDYCVLTQKIPNKKPYQMSGVDPKYFIDETFLHAWKILGECSELVIQILKPHKKGEKIPIGNISQFLHFLGNQFMVKMVQIPMP